MRSLQEPLQDVDVPKLPGLITPLIRCQLLASRRAEQHGDPDGNESRMARGQEGDSDWQLLSLPR